MGPPSQQEIALFSGRLEFWRSTGSRPRGFVSRPPTNQTTGPLQRSAQRLLNFTRVLRFRWEKSTPDDPQGGDNRHGKVDTHDSPDRASNHYCEDGQQRMDFQFVAHDAWGNPVVHRYPPQAKQRGHPNQVGVHYEPNRGNDSQRRNPADDGNK